MLDDGADVVHAGAVLRDGAPEVPLVGARPLRDCPGHVTEVVPGDPHRGRVVVDGEVDRAVGHLVLERADRFGPENAETTTLDHGGATHAQVAAGDPDQHVGTAGQHRVAREAIAGHDRHERDETAQPGEVVEGHAVEARDAEPIGVARPATAAFGEAHHGKASPLGQFEEAIHLLVAEQALGAGEDGGVIGAGHDRGAVDPADAADESVGGCAVDELVERATTPLGGDDEGAVLHERSVVEQIGQVLPGRVVAGPMAASDGAGAMGVGGAFVAVDDGAQIGAHLVDVGRDRNGPASDGGAARRVGPVG